MTIDIAKYGPWALIAGASEGTGRAFARNVAASGLNCILIARREGPLNDLADEICAESGVECVACSVDLSAADACERIVAAVGPREVGLYIHNAGSDPQSGRFLDLDIAVLTRLVNFNVVTPMRCCHHFGRMMCERKRGGIILVGSGACYGGASYRAVYSGTKAFDLCMGEGMWAEFRPHGVDVLNLILGRTDTASLRKHLAHRGLPVPPGLASVEDVAEAGLARLPFGPVHNMGLADDEVGRNSPDSAAMRRNRILMADEMSKDIFGAD